MVAVLGWRSAGGGKEAELEGVEARTVSGLGRVTV